LTGHAPTGADLVQTGEFQDYIRNHPAGKVTGIDQHTGLPIVDRQSQSIGSQPASIVPEQVAPEAQKAATEVAKEPDLKSEIQKATPEVKPAGATEPETGRDVLQPTDHPVVNQALATQDHPGIKAALVASTEKIPGVSISGDRGTKPADRLAEKVAEDGQPSETIPDYSGFRVSVDSPEARDKAVAAIREQFPVVREKDEFENGSPEEGFHAHMMQVQGQNGATHEIQVLPKEVANIAEPSHDLYEKSRGGDKDAQSQLKTQNEEAWQRFQDRNVREPRTESKPEQPLQIAKNQAVLLPDGRTGTVNYYDAKITRNARVTTEDGERIQSVPGKSLTPIAPVKVELNHGSDAEKEIAKRTENDGPKLVAQFRKLGKGQKGIREH